MTIIPFYVAGRPKSARTNSSCTARSTVERSVGPSYASPETRSNARSPPPPRSRAEVAALPAHVRAGALDHVSRRLAERADEIARLITAENGKPIKWARGEVGRAISTFRWAAEEARRYSGDVQRLDTDPAATGRIAFVKRVPKGPVLGISPFNFPLNLVAHKVAPAIAVGAPIVLKPAPATPLSALLLGEILAETDLPAGMFSVLPIPNDRAASLVADPRLPVVSFTGSGPVGAMIRSAVPHKHVTLELGGNAAAVVCGDWSSAADLEWAAGRIATFANYQAGQSCIAVQRVIVHTDLYDEFVPLLVGKVKALPTGDVMDETVEVGPVINDAAADRIEEWVRAAEAAGARNLTGWNRDGNQIDPIVLEGAPAAAWSAPEEVFGPVLVVSRVDSDADGVRGGERLGVRAAGRRVHAQSADRVHGASGARGGRRDRRRRPELPGRPDAVRRREGLRRRARGPAQRDGRLHRARVMVLTGIDL